MKILSDFKNKIGNYPVKETKGIININYTNLSNIITPFEPKGANIENSYYQIILDEEDLIFIKSLYDWIEPIKKYENGFLLSLSILIISKIISKPIYKIFEVITRL